MSGSLCLTLLLNIYNSLNRWYENSLCYIMIQKTAGWVVNSFAYRLVCTESPRQFAQGSLIFRLFYAVFNFFARIAQYCYDFYDRLSQGSFLRSTLSTSAVSFIRLDVVFAAFLLGMCIVPNDSWNNMYILYAAVFFAFMFVARVLARARKGLPIERISPALLAYISLAFLSLFVSYRLSDSLRVLAIALSCILIGVTLQGMISTKKALKTFVLFLFIGAFVSSLYGLYQYKMGIEVRADYVDLTYSAGLRRLFSSMDNPNNYAEFLIMLLPFCAATVLTAKTDLKRLLYAALIAPCLLALVLTGSRAAYIAVVVSAGIYVLLINKRLIPFFVLLFVASLPFWPGFIVERIMTIGKDTSSAYRIMIWEGARDMLKVNWFTGIGMGPVTFANTFRNFVDSRASTAMHCHNLFLQIWSETGVCGLIAFLVFIANTIKSSIALTFSCKNNEYKHYLSAFMAGTGGILLFGMVEYVWFYPRIMLTFWVIMGLGMATVQLARGEQA